MAEKAAQLLAAEYELRLLDGLIRHGLDLREEPLLGASYLFRNGLCDRVTRDEDGAAVLVGLDRGLIGLSLIHI